MSWRRCTICGKAFRTEEKFLEHFELLHGYYGRESSKEMTELREIINTYDQLKSFGGDRIAILWRPQDLGRAGIHAAWLVTRIKDGKELRTDEGKGWWRDYGHKSFWGMGGVREWKTAKLQEAITWANKKYGKRDFVRNRLGDWVEREVNEKFPIPKSKIE